MFPVIRMSFRFRKTIHYDDLLTVKTTLKSMKGARIWMVYKLYNSTNELVNEAETELACVCRNSWKPCLVPDFITKAIEMNSKQPLFHA
jgi:acyl-CoA thioester hydrolase